MEAGYARRLERIMIDFKQLTPARVKMVTYSKKIYIPAIGFAGNFRRLHKICKTATEAQEYAKRLIAKGMRMKHGN